MRLHRLILMLLILLLAACSGDSDVLPTPVIIPTETPPPTMTPVTPSESLPTSTPLATALPMPRTTADTPQNQSFVRIVHAGASVQPIDIYIDGLNAGFNLVYGTVTAPTPIVGGVYRLRAFPTGASTGSEPLIRQDLTIPAGRTLTLVFTGTPDFTDVNIFEEVTEPLDANQSRMQVIHAVRDNGPVRLERDGETLTIPVGFLDASAPIDVESGSTPLAVSDTDGNIIAEYTGERRSRHAITLIVTGDAANPESLRLLDFSTRVVGRGQMRVINMMTDLPAVDVFINDEAVFPSAEYGRATDHVALASGMMEVDVFRFNTTENPLQTTQFTLNDDQTITLIVVGTMDNAQIIRWRDERDPTPPDQARITFVHTLPMFNQVEVRTLEDSRQPERLRYREVSRSAIIPAGTYTFRWDSLDTGDNIEDVSNITLEAGSSYIYLLSGNETPVIFGDVVGADEVFDFPIGQTGAVVLPAQFRFINMLESRETIDIYLDNIPVGIDFPHGQASESLVIAEGEYAVVVYPPGADPDFDPILGGQPFAFLDDTDYTIYIRGQSRANVEVVVHANGRRDRIRDSSQAIFRLVNLTIGADTRFNLAIAPSDQQITTPMADPEDPDPVIPFRDPAIGGLVPTITGVSSGVIGGEASITPGSYTIAITDSLNDGLAATFAFDFEAEAGARYDFIVQQRPDSLEVDLFIVAYP